ncbi:hypothetical protein BN1723_000603 [Verticillium longisporum]|uniref:Anaphase-promoting complex subunit 4 n=1 Tax=Verticillium longisporum TaxID=100787 RepID=A0A0G4MXV5_VERLO|nr:hypothetical protein BN1723_000603 [Verticillium longisporum]
MSRRVRVVPGSCWPCKKRRVRCDLTKPACRRCIVDGGSCDYNAQLIRWSTRPSVNLSQPLAEIAASAARRSPCLKIEPPLANDEQRALGYFQGRVWPLLTTVPNPCAPPTPVAMQHRVVLLSMCVFAASHRYLQDGRGAELITPTRSECLQVLRTQVGGCCKDNNDMLPTLLFAVLLLYLHDGLVEGSATSATMKHHVGVLAILDQLGGLTKVVGKGQESMDMLLSEFASADLTTALLQQRTPGFAPHVWDVIDEGSVWWGRDAKGRCSLAAVFHDMATLATYHEAVRTGAESLAVDRIRAFEASLQPVQAADRGQGQFLAVGWSDGHVRLMGLENNKAAHHIRVTEDQSAGITHIGWACNSVSKTDSVLKEADTASWRHALAEELQTAGNPPELDLPRELTFLDVESSLPKLSPLPSASAGEGEDAMVFTLRTGIDFLFRPFNTAESDEVFVMVVGTSDGRLHLSIYDSFVIGDFRYTLPSSMYKPGVLQLIHHAAHPSASTHCLILKHPADDDRAVYLVPMDLPFVPYSPINLALLASKLTTLQKLLRYVKQSQLHATVEYNNTRELPSKFLRSIQEDLQGAERGPTDIVQALFHTVVTGHTHEVVKEWLVDQLAERGHKRWDKAAVSGLEALRALVHENLLPALERCAVILSRLRGLAQFHDARDDIGFSAAQGHKRWDKAAISGLEALRALVHENLLPALERCAVILSRLRGLAQFHDARDDIGFSAAQVARAMDVVACLRLAAHRVLLHVMEELDLFTAFSGWLRFQIDRLASSSSATEELNEKEAGLENGKVLAYIQRYLLRSPMALFFEPVAEDEREADWKFVQNEPALLDAVDAQIARQEDGQPYMKALPQLAFLVAYLEDRADGIFKDIAEAQKRSVRFGQPTLNEKEAGLENGKVLAYIQRYLLRSPMALFFDPVADDEREADWKFVQNEPALLDAVDAQIAWQEDGQPYMKALPQLAFLVAYLEDRADGIFKDIAEAQKRSVRFGQPTRIVMGSKMSRIDCVMGPIVNGNDLEDHASTFVAAIQEGKEDERKFIGRAVLSSPTGIADSDEALVYIFRTTVRIINGISTTTSKTCAALRLGDHKITDIKFLGHETLLPIQTPETKYAPYTEESLPEPEPLSAAHGFTSFTLPEGSGGGGGSPPWVPVRMEVQPRSDVRDDMPPRVCLLGRDRTTWRVFALEKDAAVPQQQEQEQENEQQQQQEQQVSTPGRDNA